MDESKGLYFIPIIARALESKDQEQALREAFEKIIGLGSKPEFKEGFRQFEEFVRAAVTFSLQGDRRRAGTLRDAIHHLIHDLAIDTTEVDEERKSSLINLLKRFPDLYGEYERIRRESEDLAEPNLPMEIEVLREGRLIGSSPRTRHPHSIGPIFPGRYKVQLANGRVLWEGDLTREDLIWAFAHPEKDLPLAAETETTKAIPTKRITLLEGELEMHIFAGLEAGALRVESKE